MWLSQNKGPYSTVTQRRLNRSKCFKSYNLTGWTLKLPKRSFYAQIWSFSTVGQKVIIWSALRSLRAVYKGSVQPWLGLTCYKSSMRKGFEDIVLRELKTQVVQGRMFTSQWWRMLWNTVIRLLWLQALGCFGMIWLLWGWLRLLNSIY